jgi:uncharacterized membrane protein YkoI
MRLSTTACAMALTLMIPPLVVNGADAGTSSGSSREQETDQPSGTLARIPEAVRKTVLRESGGIAPTTLERTSSHGRTVYKARIERDGDDLKLTVDEDGALVWRNDLKARAKSDQKPDGMAEIKAAGEREKSGRIAIEEAPEAVRATILREASGQAIERIEREVDNDKTFYRAKIRTGGGKTVKVTVAEDGSVVAGSR